MSKYLIFVLRCSNQYLEQVSLQLGNTCFFPKVILSTSRRLYTSTYHHLSISIIPNTAVWRLRALSPSSSSSSSSYSSSSSSSSSSSPLPLPLQSSCHILLVYSSTRIVLHHSHYVVITSSLCHYHIIVMSCHVHIITVFCIIYYHHACHEEETKSK